jgi:hypothetical protein
MIYDQLVKEFAERDNAPPLDERGPEQERTPEQPSARDWFQSLPKEYGAA